MKLFFKFIIFILFSSFYVFSSLTADEYKEVYNIEVGKLDIGSLLWSVSLDKNNLTTNDINMLIPHQANLRITQMVQKKLGLRDDQVYSNIHKYGNTTAATIPIALAEVVKSKKIKNGDIIIFASFGSGFTWGSAAIKW